MNDSTKPFCIGPLSDNGTELTSNAILKWQQDRRVAWHYIQPGKPMQNGLVESLLTKQLYAGGGNRK